MIGRVVLAFALAVLLLALAAAALGAEPSASPSMASSLVPTAAPSAASEVLLESGDLRSEGEGPGLGGSPLLIVGAVVLLGLVTAGLTLVLVRLLQRD